MLKMTSHRFVISLVLSVIGSCSFFPKKEPIWVGYVDSFSGPRAVFGISTRNGIQMAVDEWNAKGGLHGRKMALIISDDEGVPEKSKVAAQDLVNKHPQMVALLGATASSRSLVMAPIAQSKKIPMITPSSTHPKVTEVGDYIFRVCFVDALQGPVMAKFLKNELKIQKVAIMRDLSTQYSLGLSEFFKKRFIKLGGEIVSDQTYRAGDIDFKPQLTRIKKQRPQLIYIPGYFSEVVRIVRQAKELGLEAQFAGGDGWDSEELKSVIQEQSDKAYFTAHFSPESDDVVYSKFKQRYQRRYRRDPDAFSALGYDAAYVLLRAIESSHDVHPEQIKNQLAQTRDFPGVTGKITLDRNRNAVKPVVILRVENGQSKLIQTYDVSEAS